MIDRRAKDLAEQLVLTYPHMDMDNYPWLEELLSVRGLPAGPDDVADLVTYIRWIVSEES